MYTKQNRVYLISYLLLLLVFLGTFLWMAGQYLLALLLGATLALLINPAYEWLIEKGFGRVIASAVVTILVLALIIVPMTGFIIISVNQGIDFLQYIAGLKELPEKTIANIINRWEITKVIIGNHRQVSVQIQNGMQVASQYATASAIDLVKIIPELFLQVALVVISCFFCLLDGKRFIGWLFSLHAVENSIQSMLMETFQKTAVSTIFASFAAAACQAFVLFAGFLFLGLPEPFLFGGLTFILAWLPVLGPTPIWVSGMVYLYLHGAITKMIFMLVIGIIIGSIDNIIRALILKGRSSLHPLLGLVSIIGGISMLGIIGVIVGPILVTMLIALLEIWPLLGKQLGFYVDEKKDKDSG